jgi:DNA helicase-2/ATP-dependent DNA helicase PcrA
MSLQVQLYARAAAQILGEVARTGNVHLLKDKQRVQIPITREAVNAALANVEWAVQGILAGDFPMRPHPAKCARCDFAKICPQQPQKFSIQTTEPPSLHLPAAADLKRR